MIWSHWLDDGGDGGDGENGSSKAPLQWGVLCFAFMSGWYSTHAYTASASAAVMAPSPSTCAIPVLDTQLLALVVSLLLPFFFLFVLGQAGLERRPEGERSGFARHVVRRRWRVSVAYVVNRTGRRPPTGRP